MIVYLDMDGVLVDFVGGALKLFNKPKSILKPAEYHLEKLFGITTDEFWERIDAEGESFWTNLEVYPHTSKLISMVEEYADEWHICTAPAFHPNSFSGKVKTLHKLFGRKFRNFVITPHKQLLANNKSVLIDDSDHKCKKFIAAGGDAILFPQMWNKAYFKRDTPLSSVEEALIDYKYWESK